MVYAARFSPLLCVLAFAAVPLAAQQRSSSTFITAEEIGGMGSMPGTAFDVVRSLRPRWLQNRGLIRLPDGYRDHQMTQVRVYLDERDMGDVEYLRTIPAERIHSLRYLSLTEAGARFGPSAGPGIVVTLKT